MEKREEEKTKKLENDTITTGLTVAAVTKAKNQNDYVVNLGAKIIEKPALVLASTDNTTTKKKSSTKQKPKGKVTSSKKKPKSSKKKTEVNEDPKEQKGTRQVPKPRDEHGCMHCGIFDLKTLSRDDLKYYTKEGAWLEKKPCLDCDKKELGTEEKVMDVGVLLNWKGLDTDEMARYCNYGAGAHGSDDPSSTSFACNMVLCNPCYTKRVEGAETQLGTNSRRSNRNRK